MSDESVVSRAAQPVRRQWWAWVGLGLTVVVLVGLGASRQPPTGVSDERLVALAVNLKCLQCVGESVAGSQAPIAVQMRAEIERQARQGASDDEIYSWFADRYGQRVLLNPPATGIGAVIWVLPVVVCFVGAGLVASAIGRRRRDGEPDAAAADEGIVAEIRARRVHRGGSE